MELTAIACVAGLVLAFSLISKKLGESWLTPPLFFTAAGLLFGARGLGLMELQPESRAIHLLAEATLVFVLFTDAARIDVRALRRNFGLPVRLLSIGMPLQIILGTLIAIWLLPDLGLWQSALLASVLAPTDAALGQAVVTDPRIPDRIRQTLNVESGLNDGIALPLVRIFVATCLAMEGHESTGYWASFVARQIGWGTVVGLGIGAMGAWLMVTLERRGFIAIDFRQIGALAVAALAWSVAHFVDGNGFIAAFVAGLAFGAVARDAATHLCEFAEEEGKLLTLVTFLLFGAVLLPTAWPEVTPVTVLYAILSLTLVRMLPVAMALVGTGLRPATVGFLGWFGPRGLASVLFALLIVEEAGVAGAPTIVATSLLCVLFSVVLHGVTAKPGVAWLVRRLEGCEDPRAEMIPVPFMLTRGMGREAAASLRARTTNQEPR